MLTFSGAAAFAFSRGSFKLWRVDDEVTDEQPLLSRWGLALAAALTLVAAVLSFMLLPPVAALATILLAALMVLITLIDLRHYIIPNVLSYPAVPLGVLANIAVFHGNDWTAGLIESVTGAVLAGGSFYLLRAAWFRLRGFEGLGLGDVKLAAVAGAWLGPLLLASTFLVAALGGLAAVAVMAVLPGRQLKLGDPIPFGSFIAPAILLFWAWRLSEAVPFW